MLACPPIQRRARCTNLSAPQVATPFARFLFLSQICASFCRSTLRSSSMSQASKVSNKDGRSTSDKRVPGEVDAGA